MRGFVVVVRDRTKRRGCALVESTQEAGVQDVQEKGEYFTRRGRKVCNKHRSESSKSVCSRDKVGFVRIGWQGGVFVVSEQEVGVQGVQRTTGYFTRVNCKVRSEFKSESSKVGCE